MKFMYFMLLMFVHMFIACMYSVFQKKATKLMA